MKSGRSILIFLITGTCKNESHCEIFPVSGTLKLGKWLLESNERGKMANKQQFERQLIDLVGRLKEHITTDDGQWTVKGFVDVLVVS